MKFENKRNLKNSIVHTNGATKNSRSQKIMKDIPAIHALKLKRIKKTQLEPEMEKEGNGQICVAGKSTKTRAPKKTLVWTGKENDPTSSNINNDADNPDLINQRNA